MRQQIPPAVIDGWDFSPDRLMRPAEVSAAFRVDPKTLAGWARAGKITAIRTPGGQRRYSRQQVNALMSGVTALAEQRDDLHGWGHTVTVETITTGLWIVERTDGWLGPVRRPDPAVSPDVSARGYADLYGALYVPAGGAE